MQKFLILSLRLNNLNFSQVGKCHCDCFVHDSPPLLAALPSQLPTSSSSPHLQILELSTPCWHLFKEHSRSLPRHYIEPVSYAPLGIRASTASTKTCSKVPRQRPSTNCWEKVLTGKTFSSEFPHMPMPLCTNVIVISKSLGGPVCNLCLLYRAIQKDFKIKYFLNTKAVSVAGSDT